MKIVYLDVAHAFVRAKLDAEIYMKIHDGCGDMSGNIVRLNTSLYLVWSKTEQFCAEQAHRCAVPFRPRVNSCQKDWHSIRSFGKAARGYIIKIKIHSSCEIKDFVETHLCKLCVILRSRALRVVCPH